MEDSGEARARGKYPHCLSGIKERLKNELFIQQMVLRLSVIYIKNMILDFSHSQKSTTEKGRSTWKFKVNTVLGNAIQYLYNIELGTSLEVTVKIKENESNYHKIQVPLHFH